MTQEMDDTDKLKVLYEDANKFGITFDPPDVNSGTYRFEPVTAKVIRYGLCAIKGTGRQAIDAIVAARKEGGAFTSFYDFCVRVDRSKMNKRTVEALIKGGAFDKIHLNRAELLASVERAFEFAATTQANANQSGLFDMSDSHAASTQEPPLVEMPAFGVKARLVLEKTAIGFYLSGHLFDEVVEEVRQFAKRSIADMNESRDAQLLAGIVGDLRVINGNRGKMIIFKLDDKTDSLECSVDENLFNAQRNLLKDDELVVVQGTLQGASERFGRRFKITQVWGLEMARCRFGKYLKVAVNGTEPDIARLTQEFPPRAEVSDQGEISRGLAVRLNLRRPGVVADLQLGDVARFFPSDAALASWTAQAHKGLVKIVYE
jgi:DNA polymerase-3 subunit alpha